MRLDKYLKVSRILKRRTVSKELAHNNRVLVNGKICKPAYEVKLNDEIEVIFGRRHLVVKVLQIKEVVKKNDADILYEVVKEWTEPEENLFEEQNEQLYTYNREEQF